MAFTTTFSAWSSGYHSLYDLGMYQRTSDDSNGNHVWQLYIVRSAHDNAWGSPNSDYSIRWTGSVWEDASSSGNPTSVSLSGTTVSLYETLNPKP